MCILGEVRGVCQATGFCSFPDGKCESGQRYGELAGSQLGGSCVPNPTTEDPSGSSTGSATGDPTISPSTTTTTTTTTTDKDPSIDTNSSTTDSMGEDLQPNGSTCMANHECESGACFLAGILGGICGDCLSEADCEFGGCNPPNPLATPPIGAVCNDGGIGGGCNTPDACVDEGAVCATIINVPGILSASTCSECDVTADCETGVCNVAVDIATISGEKTCVEEGSVADGDFCDLEGHGDAACMNHCGTADIMGLAQFGVCGECRNVDGESEGCADGHTCTDPMVGLDGAVVPSVCE